MKNKKDFYTVHGTVYLYVKNEKLKIMIVREKTE